MVLESRTKALLSVAPKLRSDSTSPSLRRRPEPATFVSGWGVYIVEGVRKTAVFCVLLFLFAVGISVGVIYAAVYKTSEQGWGIAAVLTAFLFAVIGSVYTYWDEEYS